MFAIEVISWIVLGLVLGAGAHSFQAAKPIRLYELLVTGAIGAFIGGLLFYGLGTTGTFSAIALLTAAIGSVLVLLIDLVIRTRPPLESRPHS